MTTALGGLKVVDLSPNRVGAQISQLFADYGAEVVWVEPPGGSAIRDHPAFPFWARGKRSVVLDLHTDAGRAAVRDLLADADVLVETFRPGVLDRLGLDEATLRALNPRLVHTSVTAFGRHGPYVDVQGYEGVVAAKVGLFQGFGRAVPGPRPAYVDVPWCSFAAIQVALYGTLAALYEREHSGLGQLVETNLAHAVTTLDTWGWYEQLIEHKWPGAYQRLASYDEDEIPTTPFAYFLLVAMTADGHRLQFAQTAPHLFKALMKALGLESYFGDPKWEGIPVFADRERREELWSEMLAVANTKTLAEWQEIFERDPNVFAEVFRSGPGVLDHPQILWDGSAVEVVDAERGVVRQPGPLAKLSGTPGDVSRSAPLLDADHAVVEAASSAVPAPAPAGPPPTGLPLDGVTVVELAVQFAAPHGTTLLTELGARVIKIESIEGDPIRTILPFPETGAAKVMAGKETICIDLATEEGVALAREIIAGADVVMQGFRAGATTRLGLDDAGVRAINPDVVYVNATGYGTGGPNGHRPAYAPSIGAAAGVVLGNIGSVIDERPGMSLEEIRHGTYLLTVGGTICNAQSDGIAALGVATAVMLGVLARARGAGGQELTTTMLNTNAHAMSAVVVDYPGSAGVLRPDRELRGLSARYRTYDTTDGWVFLAVPAARDWERFVAAMKPYVDLTAVEGDAALVDALTAVFATRGKDEWERELLAADVACVAVTTTSIEDWYLDERIGEPSGYLAEGHHPIFEDHPRMSALVRYSRSATQVGAGNTAGQHTDAILTELGRDAASIADLRARNIVA